MICYTWESLDCACQLILTKNTVYPPLADCFPWRQWTIMDICTRAYARWDPYMGERAWSIGTESLGLASDGPWLFSHFVESGYILRILSQKKLFSLSWVVILLLEFQTWRLGDRICQLDRFWVVQCFSRRAIPINNVVLVVHRIQIVPWVQILILISMELYILAASLARTIC